MRRRRRLPPGLPGRIGKPGFEAFREAPRHEQIEALRLAAMKQDRHPVKLGLRRSAKPRARSRSKNTTASAASAPFLVAPSESTSMPAFQVASAGLHPSRAMALASRAPSMCIRSPWRFATPAISAIAVSE